MIGLTIGGYFVLVHLYFNDLAISCMKTELTVVKAWLVVMIQAGYFLLLR